MEAGLALNTRKREAKNAELAAKVRALNSNNSDTAAPATANSEIDESLAARVRAILAIIDAEKTK